MGSNDIAWTASEESHLRRLIQKHGKNKKKAISTEFKDYSPHRHIEAILGKVRNLIHKEMPIDDKPYDDMINMTEASRVFNINEQKLRDFIKSGRVPHVVSGRSVFFDIAIMDIIADSMVKVGKKITLDYDYFDSQVKELCHVSSESWNRVSDNDR